MDKIEAIAYVRGFMEYAGLTEEDLVGPETPKEPTVDDLCPRKRWVPKLDHMFWYVSMNGVYTRRWFGDEDDFIAHGNVFPTEEDAREHLANMKAWVELRERSSEYSPSTGHTVSLNGWPLPGVRFKSSEARGLAVAAVGGQERIEKLIKWIHNK